MFTDVNFIFHLPVLVISYNYRITTTTTTTTTTIIIIIIIIII
jgi:hypothetical protein